jgi:fatty-acyl-CoA synthase
VVPQNLIEGFHQRGVPVGQVYGSTETTPIAAVLRKEDAYSKAGSTGKPALHCDVKIVDDSGMELPPHESGELWVKGPNLMFEYWGDPKATSEAFREGWFQSGDIGFRDEEGFITINDRKKDIIISGGENIYPAEVESILRKLDAVADVAVVGRKDPDWGEVPFAYIELKSGMTFDEMETRKICSEQLARFKNPKSYIVLEQLPRNTMGKVLKYQLRENAKTLN